jgi:hypothetical protein
MPKRIAKLPIDARGYPIPWFVAEVDGSRADFRVADARKRRRCVLENLCWVCGQRIKAPFTFVIGPMCAVTRTTSGPPVHEECAEFSLKACPFLLLPRAKRRDSNLPEGTTDSPGMALDRNPGVGCEWMSRTYKTFDAGNGWMITVGEPQRIRWWAQGREATKEEILYSLDTGMPALRSIAEEEGGRAPLELDYLYQNVVLNFVPTLDYPS